MVFKISSAALRSRGPTRTLVATLLLACRPVQGDPVPVRYMEGAIHAFLALRALGGQALADGDLVQTTQGDRVTSRLVFRFKDGSLQDETVVFTQQRAFRVLTDHLIQKGPAFDQTMETWIDAAKGDFKVQYVEKGAQKVATRHLVMPPDLANGMLLTLLKNIPPNAAQTTVSMVAATPEPRLVKVVITPGGQTRFSTGASTRNASRFVVKIDLGGIVGVVAPLIGKQPADSQAWIFEEGAPAFLRAEVPLYPGGPICRIEVLTPTWSTAESPAP